MRIIRLSSGNLFLRCFHQNRKAIFRLEDIAVV